MASLKECAPAPLDMLLSQFFQILVRQRLRISIINRPEDVDDSENIRTFEVDWPFLELLADDGHAHHTGVGGHGHYFFLSSEWFVNRSSFRFDSVTRNARVEANVEVYQRFGVSSSLVVLDQRPG